MMIMAMIQLLLLNVCQLQMSFHEQCKGLRNLGYPLMNICRYLNTLKDTINMPNVVNRVLLIPLCHMIFFYYYYFSS